MIGVHQLEPLEAAVSLLYPPVCTICGGNVQAGEYLCNGCEVTAARIVAPFCQLCSEPFEGSITNEFTCANCSHRELYFHRAVSAYRGRESVRESIPEFKYGPQIHRRHRVARRLRAALDDNRLRGRQF